MSTERSSRSSIWLNLWVIVPIAVLGYIAWPPTFHEAKRSEARSLARMLVGSLNRAQQAYYLETNKFVTENSDLDKLGLGIKPEGEHYRYMISGGVLAYRVIPTEKEPRAIVSIAVPKNPSMKSYVGIVWTPQRASGKTQGANGKTQESDLTAQESDTTTMAVLCEAEKPGMTGAPTPLPVEEKRDFWSNFLNFFTRSIQKQLPAVGQETPSFEQATRIEPVRDRNGLLKKIPCPQGFKALNY